MGNNAKHPPMYPGEVANAMIFMVSDMGRKISGAVLAVDDGWSAV